MLIRWISVGIKAGLLSTASLYRVSVEDLRGHADDGKEDAAGIFVGLQHGSGSGYLVNRRIAVSPSSYPVLSKNAWFPSSGLGTANCFF
ncbi:MAG: hypothetical protein D3908_14590 [Candidatus Electrothrix sp. AUS4]|nr:hypothetical protein [Candidatus Electrothrix sp. AUS4]